MTQRITYINNYDGKASTRTFRESTHGTTDATREWEAIKASPFVLCAVWRRGGADYRRWHIGLIGEWEA